MKLALCTGINSYPNPANNLAGCRTDAANWSKFLADTGFHVTTLFDLQVTRSVIKNWLNTNISNAKAGDIIVFQYSGHGTTLQDQNGDEADGVDEALYVWDGSIRDDDLRVIFNKIPKNVHVVVILDSCFSGSATKVAKTKGYRKPRFIVTSKTVISNKKASKVIDNDLVEVLISGCSDGQYSFDAEIDGQPCGAFSYYALKSLKLGQTYNEFYTALREYLPSNMYPQTPLVTGKENDLNKVVFSIEIQPIPNPQPEPGPEPTPDPPPTPDPEPENHNFIWWIKNYWFYVLLGVFILITIFLLCIGK